MDKIGFISIIYLIKRKFLKVYKLPVILTKKSRNKKKLSTELAPWPNRLLAKNKTRYKAKETVVAGF